VLKTRLLTAAVALPALWLIIQYLPAVLFNGFIVLVVTIGLYEYFTMAMPAHPLERVAGVVWGIAVAGGVVWGRPEAWGAALALSGMTGFALVLASPNDLTGAVNRLGLLVLGVLYVGFFLPHAVLMRSAGPDGWRWALFTVYVAMASDSGGYFSGRAFGRRRLAPQISPSKTVEGGIGAVALAVLIALLSRAVFAPLLGFREAIALGVAVSLLAQLGDLCESALKRAFGAKDSGWIIPGHGGILDRLDSILIPVVFVYYYAALPRG
jgi:phosphatidate cytidylyltransferase